MNLLLDPIAPGPLGNDRARHLLNRALAGPRLSEINEFSLLDIDVALDRLLGDEELPGPPLQVFGEDPDVEFGTTWVEAPLNGSIRFQRKKSLRAWWMGQLINQQATLREKMVLFWHNHFVTETNVVSIPAYLYQYITLLRDYALGNFRDLAAKMTINTAMLRYLDGKDNTAKAPNENYARELFELFTIGKGPQKGEGDYTFYTEQDVQEAARVLTGWKIDNDTLSAVYKDWAHDKNSKIFSAYYNSKVITNEGDKEYESLISMIFSSKQTAITLATKIYRWFVYYEIDEEVREKIILPLADLLYDNNYELKPVLRTLLSSQHFYDAGLRGAMIKSPLEFVAGTARRLELDMTEDLSNQYEFWNLFYLLTTYQEQDLGSPPDVAGWPAYYLEPQFNRLWINAATLPQRSLFSEKILKNGYYRNKQKLIVSPIALAEMTPDPSAAETLIRAFCSLMIPSEPEQGLIDQLMEVLIPGLPDFEWTVEWNNYKKDPGNDANRKAVETSLSDVLLSIMQMPQYHLC